MLDGGASQRSISKSLGISRNSVTKVADGRRVGTGAGVAEAAAVKEVPVYRCGICGMKTTLLPCLACFLRSGGAL